MKRVMIVGSSGAGKTTLARELSKILDIKVTHLDKYFWKPGWEKPSGDAWTDKVAELVQGDSWIMDGNYKGTMELRLKAADTLIFLDFPRLLCIARVLRRFLTFIGRSRPDVGEGCNEKIDREFIKWIWDFPKNSRPRIIECLQAFEKEKNIIILHKPSEVAAFLKTVK